MKLKKARTIVLTGAALACLALPADALAAGASTSVSLLGGSLSFSTTPSASNFASTALTGSQQTIRTNLASWGVTDATGSNAGWHVTFQASQFTGAGPITLPAGSLVLSAPVITPNGVNLAVPPLLQGASFTLDGGSAVAIAHALTGTGQGAWTMTQANAAGGDLALTIPADAAAGTYTSNLTFTLATGP
ncbi:MAG TPA: WxL domain-containing protein [Solirubrobacteraceae bacterium]|nr:WxL domain-containing protein [Solirubrobacteraceae bacterium]